MKLRLIQGTDPPDVLTALYAAGAREEFAFELAGLSHEQYIAYLGALEALDDIES
jgi:hypothetical protein